MKRKVRASLPRLLVVVFFLLTASVRAESPLNDNFAAALVLSGSSVSVTGSNRDATNEPGEPGILHNFPRATVWYRWTAPTNGLLTVTTEGSSFDTLLGVFAGGSVGNLKALAENDDARGSTSSVYALVEGGTDYQICVDGYEGGVGEIKLSLVFTEGVARPPNDNFADATALVGTNINLSASSFLATMESGELTPTTVGGSSVWWLWDAPATGRFLISTEGSDFDTILSVYAGTRLITWSDNVGTNRAAAVRFINRIAGTRYYISVQGYGNTSGSIQLKLRPDPLQPAPAWSVIDVNGETRLSSEFLGKVVLLDFWATWCGPCVEQITQLKAIKDRYAAEGFEIVGVATDPEGFSVVTPFTESNALNYVSAVTNPEIEKSYGPVDIIPVSYLVDHDGMLIFKYVGDAADSLETNIRELLTLPVSLRANVESGQIFLRWPAVATGYVLQSASSLPAPDWTNVNVAILSAGSDKLVRLPLTNQSRAFRLLRN